MGTIGAAALGSALSGLSARKEMAGEAKSLHSPHEFRTPNRAKRKAKNKAARRARRRNRL